MISNMCFISKVEHKNVKKEINNEYLVNAIHEELAQFLRNEEWELVPRPNFVNIIDTKWDNVNKSDENENVTTNKTQLVA